VTISRDVQLCLKYKRLPQRHRISGISEIPCSSLGVLYQVDYETTQCVFLFQLQRFGKFRKGFNGLFANCAYPLRPLQWEVPMAI
jgi:hypothetical protein